MPSSTSSFEPRKIPSGRWGGTWLVALVLAIVALWRLEVLTRATGQRPSVVDAPELWGLARNDVDDDPRLVVFIGASRMALGYSASAFAEAAPGYRGLQLSISDHLCVGVLQDLANDDTFRGIAVLDLLEIEVGDPLFVTDADAYVARAHAMWRAPGAVINRYLASHVQSHLALLAVGGRRMINSLVGKRAWPPPAWVAIDRERSSHADYSLAPPGALRAKADRRVEGLPPAPPPHEWLAILERELEPLVAKIRARGGDVVVVRMPISGRLAAAVDERYPRAQYWDAFAANTAAKTIHYRDVPGMALECPEEMHLDQRDQAAFTRALVRAMRDKGVLR